MAFTAGQTITAAMLAAIATPPSACAKKIAVQSIANGGSVLQFDAEDWDNNGIHNNVTNNSRFTCQTAGKYGCWGICELNSVAGSWVKGMIIRKNGASVGGISSPNSTTLTNFLSTYAEVDLGVGDYIEVFIYQNSGAGINTVVATTRGGITKISD